MVLADSHCHLDDRQYDGDRDAVLARAADAGVRFLLAIGTGEGPPDLEAGVRLATQLDSSGDAALPQILATAGIHPNDAAKAAGETFSHLRDLLQHPKVVAVGEIGLDYHYDVPRDTQEVVFRRQLALAAEARKPIVIHTRESLPETMTILRQEWASAGLPCILHCFTGSVEEAREPIELGFYLAFGGILTFNKAEEVRAAARSVPDAQLLIETDAPYLAPSPFRGKRNEPAFVAHSAEALARVRNTTVEHIGSVTTGNFQQLFCRPLASPRPIH